MLKIKNKVQFSKKANKMQILADVKSAIKMFEEKRSTNLRFLLKERFGWMNNFIGINDHGVELGSGAGFAKHFINCKNFKISDLSNYDHLDYKNIDAQETGFQSESFNFVIASNMIHHIPYPMKFFKEMNRILKKNGKLIIFEPYCSVLLQLATTIMKHEGFDFTVNVWDEKKPKSDEEDLWAGNIAVSNLIFDDKKNFSKHLGTYFKIKHEKLVECLIFFNSGGVTSKTFCLPMNNFFLKLINVIDKILIKLLPNVFASGRQIVLEKI